jgi:hypothetical protein
MNKPSRAERRQRSEPPYAKGLGAGPSSRPGELATALVMAAETASTVPSEQDSVAPTSTSVDRRDPTEGNPSERSTRPAPRPHLEDDFFARGEDIGTMRPSSYDTPEIDPVDHDEQGRRRVAPGVIERRARLRRIVASVVGAAAFLTVVVGAKAFITHPPPAGLAQSALSVPNRVVPSIAVAAAEDDRTVGSADTVPSPAAEVALAKAPSDDVRTSHRLPIVDVEIPPAPDAATDLAWETAAQSLSARDFRAADDVFADLGRRTDTATREAARLARAAWWIANGKEAIVRPVLADLAAKATTPSVQRRARELLRTN